MGSREWTVELGRLFSFSARELSLKPPYRNHSGNASGASSKRSSEIVRVSFNWFERDWLRLLLDRQVLDVPARSLDELRIIFDDH